MSATDAIALQSSPRSVPLTLRTALLSNLGVLIGLLILSAGTFFSIVFLSSGNVFGDLRLWLNADEGRGIVRGYEPTMFGSGESSRRRTGNTSRIYRVDYSFETSNEETVTGASFVSGRAAAERYARSNGNGRVAAVEYVPSAPHINRLRNTRSSPFGLGALLVLLVPAVGVMIVLAGIAHARTTIRLLRNGETANGLILKCRCLPNRKTSPTPELKRWLDYEQFRDAIQGSVADALEERGEVTRIAPVSSFQRRSEDLKVETVPIAQFQTSFNSHINLFRGLLVVFCGMAALLFAFLLWGIWSASNADPFEKIVITGVALLIGAAFAGAGLLATRFLQKAEGAVTGELKLKELVGPVECLFEFRTPDGRIIEAKSVVACIGRLIEEGPQCMVFFDRNDPQRTCLPESLPGRVQLGQQGGLVVSGTAWRSIRLVGAVVILLATIAVGLVAARQVSVLS